MTLVTPAAPVQGPTGKKKTQPVPALPTTPSAATGVMTLPMRSVGVGASVSVGGWMIPAVGVLVGGLLLGLPGALAGGIGGYLLARG